MQVAAKSLVLDLLSTMRGGSMPVALLVSAGEAFGIDANRMRVTINRMCSSGLVENDERGQYRLGPSSRSTMARVASWRAVTSATRPWNGEWLAVHTAPVLKSDRTAHRQTNKALGFFSFAPLDPGLSIRPDNLAMRVDAVRDDLAALGADPRINCFRAGSFSRRDDERARSLWDVEKLSSAYSRASKAMRASKRRLADLDEEAAMVESFIVGGGVIRLLVLDPLLPDEILPSRDRLRVADELREYDKLGRACWAPLLERHGVRVKADPGRLGTVADASARNAPGGLNESTQAI